MYRKLLLHAREESSDSEDEGARNQHKVGSPKPHEEPQDRTVPQHEELNPRKNKMNPRPMMDKDRAILKAFRRAEEAGEEGAQASMITSQRAQPPQRGDWTHQGNNHCGHHKPQRRTQNTTGSLLRSGPPDERGWDRSTRDQLVPPITSVNPEGY
jgi:hypothetical protein